MAAFFILFEAFVITGRDAVAREDRPQVAQHEIGAYDARFPEVGTSGRGNAIADSFFLKMAKTNIIVPEGVQTDYTSVIVSYSNGIDSTGALYWVLQEFPKEKIFLLYCDTGLEYPENIKMFYQTAKYIGVKPVLLQHPKGFLNLLLEERFKWPDMKNRWCTAYLKTGITDKWIRANRKILGTKCLFVSGERRDESRGRAKLPEIEFHSTTLKTKRVADFTCHWYRPCLDYEKGKMFEQGKELGLEPHFCYEYLDRCS